MQNILHEMHDMQAHAFVQESAWPKLVEVLDKEPPASGSSHK